MAKSFPLLVYLRPSDRQRLEVAALMRGQSLSYCVTNLIRDAFVAAFGATADPKTVLEKYRPILEGKTIETQRAKRKRKIEVRNSASILTSD